MRPNQSVQPTVGLGIKIPFYQSGVRREQARAATAKKGAAQLRLDGAMLQIESDLRSALAMRGPFVGVNSLAALTVRELLPVDIVVRTMY